MIHKTEKAARAFEKAIKPLYRWMEKYADESTMIMVDATHTSVFKREGACVEQPMQMAVLLEPIEQPNKRSNLN